MRDFVKGRYRDISPTRSVVALAALLYFLMPFDAVPDFILSLGMIDDFAILAWVAKHFQQELTHYQSWREKEDSRPIRSQTTLNASTPVAELADHLKVGDRLE